MRGLRSSRVKAVKKDTLIVTVDVGMEDVATRWGQPPTRQNFTAKKDKNT